MSRAPAQETPQIPLNAAMSPFGVIDFAENPALHAQYGAPPGAVVGGPPAYLEAHGIRYVPSGALEADGEELGSAAADGVQQGLVPMSRDAGTCSAAPAAITKRELDSRVDERIRKFMSDADLRGMGSRMDQRCDDWDHPSMRSRVLMPTSDVRERVRALRRDMAVGDDPLRRSERLRTAMDEEPYRRSERLRTSVDEEPYRRSERLRASSGDDDAAVRARLRTLRRECEQAAAESRRRHMGMSAAELADF